MGSGPSGVTGWTGEMSNYDKFHGIYGGSMLFFSPHHYTSPLCSANPPQLVPVAC